LAKNQKRTRINNKGWHWPAFLFGSIWYLFNGLMKKGVILLIITIFSGFIALPFIHIYCGVKAKQDLYIQEKKEKSKVYLNMI